MKWKLNIVVAIAFGILIVTSSIDSHAKGASKVIATQLQGTHIGFSVKGVAENTLITVSGPNQYQLRKSAKSGIPTIDLSEPGILVDGLYHYEITTAVGPLVLVKDVINNGRGENNSHYARQGVIHNGHFRIVNGQIKKYKSLKEVGSGGND